MGPRTFVISLLALILSLGGASYAVTRAGAATKAKPAVRSAAAVVHAWHNLTLLNRWVYGGLGDYQAGYWTDPEGIVHLRGSLRGGTAHAAVFQLPSGARPSNTTFVPIVAAGGSPAALGFAQMTILDGARIMLISADTCAHAADLARIALRRL